HDWARASTQQVRIAPAHGLTPMEETGNERAAIHDKLDTGRPHAANERHPVAPPCHDRARPRGAAARGATAQQAAIAGDSELSWDVNTPSSRGWSCRGRRDTEPPRRSGPARRAVL